MISRTPSPRTPRRNGSSTAASPSLIRLAFAVLLALPLLARLMGMAWGTATAYADDSFTEPVVTSTVDAAPEMAADAAEGQTTTDEAASPSVTDPGDGARICSVSLRGQDGARELCAQDAAQLTCAVTYGGLTVGESYEAIALLHARTCNSGGQVTGAAAETLVELHGTLVPETADGTFNLSGEGQLASCAGMGCVAYAYLLDSTGETIAAYEDPTDTEASLQVPKMTAEATDAVTGLHAAPAEDQRTIIDTISYEGLTPGCAYVACAELRACAADGTDAGAITDENGTPLRSEEAFTPESSKGTVAVKLAVDASSPDTPAVTTSQSITREGTVVAKTESSSGTSGSVSFVRMSTELLDTSDLDHTVVTGKATLKDVVSYQGLVQKTTYTLVGTLHLRSADGTDEGPLKDADGNALTVTHEFVAQKSAGSEEVVFDLPQGLSPNQVVVAFEQLKEGDIVVARHEDIADDKQQVRCEEGVTGAGTTTAATTDSSGERMPQTGRAPLGPVLIVLGALLFAAGAYALARGRRTGGSLVHGYRRRRHYVM